MDLPTDRLPLCPNTPSRPTPAIQFAAGTCIVLGERAQTRASPLNTSDPTAGVTLTLAGGDAEPGGCSVNRTVVYNMVCDPTAPVTNPPDPLIVTHEVCVYVVTWKHPSACGAVSTKACPTAPVPVPTQSQVTYLKHEIAGLTHFNMAAFSGTNGGTCGSGNWNSGANTAKASTFAPSALNLSSWVESYHALGAKHAILTAKHSCGFLLYDTKTTLPDGSAYPYGVGASGGYGKDIAELFVAAMTTADPPIGTGFYYSTGNNFFLNVHNFGMGSSLLPGQVNVTMEEYNDLVYSQLSELWSKYGKFTEIWLDGGYSPGQKPRLTQLLKTLQPQTTAFNGFGVSSNPVKWCGTESGMPAYPIWSTGCSVARGDPTASTFCPTGVDCTLQQGDHWFYSSVDPVHTLGQLIQFYHHSVGSNSVLELDFAIDTTGNVHPTHAAQYKVFGDWIRSCYGTPVAHGFVNGSSVTLQLGGVVEIDRVMVQEMIELGERVRAWTVEVQTPSFEWTAFASGTAVGHKHIALVSSPVSAVAARLTVTTSVGVPLIENFAVFKPCPSQ